MPTRLLLLTVSAVLYVSCQPALAQQPKQTGHRELYPPRSAYHRDLANFLDFANRRTGGCVIAVGASEPSCDSRALDCTGGPDEVVSAFGPADGLMHVAAPGIYATAERVTSNPHCSREFLLEGKVELNLNLVNQPARILAERVLINVNESTYAVMPASRDRWASPWRPAGPVKPELVGDPNSDSRRD